MNLNNGLSYIWTKYGHFIILPYFSRFLSETHTFPLIIFGYLKCLFEYRLSWREIFWLVGLFLFGMCSELIRTFRENSVINYCMYEKQRSLEHVLYFVFAIRLVLYKWFFCVLFNFNLKCLVASMKLYLKLLIYVKYQLFCALEGLDFCFRIKASRKLGCLEHWWLGVSSVIRE